MIPNIIQAQDTEPLLFRRWVLTPDEPTLAPMTDGRRAQLDREIETTISADWLLVLLTLVSR